MYPSLLMKIFLKIILFIVCLPSCKVNNHGCLSVVENSAKTNVLELVCYDTLLYPSTNIEAYSQEVYQDSILIVTNFANSGKPFLEFKNMSTNSLIKSFFPKGKGTVSICTQIYSIMKVILM